MAETPPAASRVKRRRSEIRLQSLVDTVLDTIVDGVITINEQGEIQSYNKACERLFGYTLEEVLGNNIKMLMPAPYRDEHDKYIHNYLRTGNAQIIGIGREVSGCRKDGTIFPMSLAVGATTEGGKHAFVGILRDITAQKAAEEAATQLRHAQKMESLGQLTGGVAHDFNNLLAIIIGNLDFLAEKVKADSHLHRYVKTSLDAALRGAELTKRLLAFGRKQALQPKIVLLNELLLNFSALVGRTFEGNIKITMQLSPDLWPVLVDAAQMEEALLNLSVNARDAMACGGQLIYETHNIVLDEFYARQNPDVTPGEYVMVAISDTGTGMTQEIIEKAFDPFFTTKEQGKGTGLGLSMVYGFVKQSAGHIKLYSEPGQGTSVKIYLPRVLRQPLAQKDKTPAQALEVKNTNPLHSDICILVVEDNPDVLEVTSAMVENLGYRVMRSTTGEEALTILSQHPEIDVLLTDVMLQDSINGPELAKQALALKPDIKVLFNSGYAQHAIFKSGLLEEGVHLLSKPFQQHQLAEKLEVLIKPRLNSGS